jgi:2,5-diketo-D-gluconate reductase A
MANDCLDRACSDILMRTGSMQTVTSNSGVAMPSVGYGVFQIPDSDECKRCVIDAIDVGYRLADTAGSHE